MSPSSCFHGVCCLLNLPGGENLAVPAEEVGCFLSLFLQCSAPSICSVWYAESRLARVVLVNVCRLFCKSRSICLLPCLLSWRVKSVRKAAFLMVFCFWPYVLSKLVSMASVTFKLPFYSMCCSQATFHGAYYSLFNFYSVLLSSCFHGVRWFQVAFLACVVFK